MVSSVRGQRPQSTKTPSAKKSGAAKTQSGKSASAAAQLSLLAASMGELTGTKKLVAPKGYQPMMPKDVRQQALKTTEGDSVTFKWDMPGLAVQNKSGKKVELVPKDQEGFASTAESLKEGVLGQPRGSEGGIEWGMSRTFGGVGAAGQLMSVLQSEQDSGGAYPNHGSRLRTFDLRAGKEVTLDQLISKEQLKSICAAIEGQLPNMTGDHGLDGTSFLPFGDLAEKVATNFAITTGPKGQPQINIGWESGVHALAGAAVKFTFAAPTDAAFKQKIGLE